MFGKAVALFFTINCCSAGLVSNDLTNVEMPGDCRGKNYCFVESGIYPRSLIDSHLKEFLGPLVEGSDSIANRNGPENPTDDCERLINFEPIYEIIDNNDNLRFVAQSDKKFLQKIRTESCLNPGRIKEHSRFFEPFQLNTWNFTCKETRIDYSFLVLSLDGNTLEDVDVKGGLPICCSCHLEEKEV